MTRFTVRAPTLKEAYSKRTAIAVKAKKEKEMEEAKAAKEIEKKAKEEALRLHMLLNGSRRTRKSRVFLYKDVDFKTPDSKWEEPKPKEVCHSPKGAAVCIDGKLHVVEQSSEVQRTAAPVEISITTKPEVRGDSPYEFDELNLGDLELLAHIAAEEQ